MFCWKWVFSAFIGLGLLVTPITCETIKGRVVGIMDGDTVRVLRGKTPFLVRLEHIDCPEKNQPYGQQALEVTSALCFLKNVTIVASKRDQYSRVLGVLYVNGTNLNKVLVKKGLAWWYRQYSKDQTYGRLEARAQKKKKGIWSLNHPEPPWVYRKRSKAWKSADPSRQAPTMAEYARKYIELDHQQRSFEKESLKKKRSPFSLSISPQKQSSSTELQEPLLFPVDVE